MPLCLVFSICSRKFVANLRPLAMVVTASLRTQSARPKPKSVRSPVKREREGLFLSFTFKKREDEKRVYRRKFMKFWGGTTTCGIWTLSLLNR